MSTANLSSLAVGDTLPQRVSGPVDRTVLALFAGASNDHTALHIDSDFAKAAGMPDVFAHGLLSMAYLAQLITHWVPQDRLLRWNVRFTAITPLHATVTSSGEIVEIFEEEGGRRARLRLRAVIDDGTPTVEGDAIIRLD